MKLSSSINMLLVIVLLTQVTFLRSMVLPETSEIYLLPHKVVDNMDLLKEHSAFMLANMNISVDPCENFYQFACGRWQNDTAVPELGRNNTFFYAMQVKVNEAIVEFFKNTSTENLWESTAEGKAKLLFASCVESSEDISQGYTYMSELMKDPVVKDDEKLDWMVLNFYYPYGFAPLLPVSVQYNTENLMFEILVTGPRAILSNPAAFNFTKLTEDFKFSKADEVKVELDELCSFEEKIIAAVPTLNDTGVSTLAEFVKAHNTSGIDWNRFFNLTFNGTVKNTWRVHTTAKDFTQLNNLLQRTDVKLLTQYVKWHNIIRFYQLWKHQAAEKTVDSKCREITIKYFGYAFIPWFIETLYDKERRADVLHMAKRIKDTFYSMLERYVWLDEETRSGAKSKLRAMDVVVGYSDDMTHREDMNTAYKTMNITKNYWQNLVNAESERTRIRSQSVGKSVVASVLSTHEVNAFYADFLNLAFVAIAISQLPLYHIQLPNSLKFGGLGNIIAHEIAHGFDSDNYKLDYNGQKRNWWTEGSLRNFQERYQCLESQYNKFVYDGLRTNGTQTSGDNIADNVGARIAYFTYQKFLEENPTEEKGSDMPLPGMNFTNTQLFFLKFAQTWCDGRSPENRLQRMETDEHAFEEFRVVGTLMNMPEFSKEFQCPLGSDMNPLKKCVVW